MFDDDQIRRYGTGEISLEIVRRGMSRSDVYTTAEGLQDTALKDKLLKALERGVASTIGPDGIAKYKQQKNIVAVGAVAAVLLVASAIASIAISSPQKESLDEKTVLLERKFATELAVLRSELEDTREQLQSELAKLQTHLSQERLKTEDFRDKWQRLSADFKLISEASKKNDRWISVKLAVTSEQVLDPRFPILTRFFFADKNGNADKSRYFVEMLEGHTNLHKFTQNVRLPRQWSYSQLEKIEVETRIGFTINKDLLELETE